MNNIGSGFEVKFYGTSLDATLNGWYGAWYGKTMISILVDGETDTSKKKMTLTYGTTDTTYNLVKNLPMGEHTVKVLKRTEGISTEMSLVDISTDGYFKKVDKTPKLKIEVYGDSITAGYGNLRGNIADTTSSQYQNGLQTYATYAASELGAEINVQARTGLGLYTAGNIEKGYNCVDIYNYDTFEGVYEWNMNDYIPDIVIINLGTNDSWNTPIFNSETYMSEYMNFIYNLVEIYGNDTAFILCSGFMETEVKSYIETIIPYLEDNIDNPVYQLTFDKCKGGHPLFEEHFEGSKKLVKLIKDNNLDVIHEHKEEPTFKEAKDVTANYTLDVEVKDLFPSYANLYVKGLGEQSIKLTQKSTFVYSANINLKEGDYEISFNIDNNDEYSEVLYETHIAHVRNYGKETIKINSFNEYPVDPAPHKDTFGWSISKRLFEATLSAVSEKELTVSNTNWMAAFTTHQTSLKDNYEFSATIKSTVTGADTDAYIGLLPYYIDDHNFVVVYLQFVSKGILKSMGCTSQSNGTDIGWNDYWSFANEPIDLNAGVKLTVIRSGKNLTIKLNDKSETKPIACMTKDNTNYGVWTYGAVSTYSNIEIKEYVDDPNEHTDTPKWFDSGHLFELTYNVDENDNITMTNQNWQAGFILTSCEYSDNYSIKATIKATKQTYINTDDVFIGFVPLYIDSSNYVVVYLQWNESSKIKSIGVTGRIDNNDLGWNDIWTFAGVDTDLLTGEEMIVSRSGATITVTFKKITGSVQINSLASLDNAFIGVWSQKTIVTYTNLSIDEIK